jgi:hypothetical protein
VLPAPELLAVLPATEPAVPDEPEDACPELELAPRLPELLVAVVELPPSAREWSADELHADIRASNPHDCKRLLEYVFMLLPALRMTT